jgi:NAD(P)-dependent dehydrogenase (short-subunit alcohol dehydrogenase family)
LLPQRSAVVTGRSKGIGLAAVQTFLAEGMQLVSARTCGKSAQDLPLPPLGGF